MCVIRWQKTEPNNGKFKNKEMLFSPATQFMQRRVGRCAGTVFIVKPLSVQHLQYNEHFREEVSKHHPNTFVKSGRTTNIQDTSTVRLTQTNKIHRGKQKHPLQYQFYVSIIIGHSEQCFRRPFLYSDRNWTIFPFYIFVFCDQKICCHSNDYHTDAG